MFFLIVLENLYLGKSYLSCGYKNATYGEKETAVLLVDLGLTNRKNQ